MTSTTFETQRAPTSLPTPAQRPEADVVIYDGHCRMCTAQIRRIERWDRGGRLAYLSLHDPEVALRYPDLSHEALMQEMVVVDRQGRRHRGAEAFRHLFGRLPLLRWLALPMHVPGSLPIWQWMYGQVARARYLLGRDSACADGSCRLHPH